MYFQERSIIPTRKQLVWSVEYFYHTERKPGPGTDEDSQKRMDLECPLWQGPQYGSSSISTTQIETEKQKSDVIK